MSDLKERALNQAMQYLSFQSEGRMPPAEQVIKIAGRFYEFLTSKRSEEVIPEPPKSEPISDRRTGEVLRTEKRPLIDRL